MFVFRLILEKVANNNHIIFQLPNKKNNMKIKPNSKYNSFKKMCRL